MPRPMAAASPFTPMLNLITQVAGT